MPYSVTVTQQRGHAPMTKVTPFPMSNDRPEAAMESCTATLPDSGIRDVARTGKDGPITTTEFVVGGQSFMGCNGGPHFTFSEGLSLCVDCEGLPNEPMRRSGVRPTADREGVMATRRWTLKAM
jgi:hypothetical protein